VSEENITRDNTHDELEGPGDSTDLILWENLQKGFKCLMLKVCMR